MNRIGFALLLLFFSHIALAEPLYQGMAAYNSGEYAKAMQILQPLAEKGDPDAQYYVGTLYADGLGVKQDMAKGLDLLEKSVKNKNRNAAIFLGKMYLSGRGVPLDTKKGTEYMELSAKLKSEMDDDEECD